jgi:hypothetical protein
MIAYTPLEQCFILLNCNTATELLEFKEELIHLNMYSNKADEVFEKLMATFLELNLI